MLSEKVKLRRTELHYACVDGNVQKIRSLLDAGADPSASDANGWTPLHFAAQANCAEGARLLIDAGAAIDPATLRCPKLYSIVVATGPSSQSCSPRALTRRTRIGTVYRPDRSRKSIANYDVARYFD